MSMPAERQVELQPKPQTGRGPNDWLGGWSTLLWGMPLVAALFIGLRIYQGPFAWYAGLDSSSPEFALYWKGLFYAEIISVSLFTGLWWGWLVRSGREIDQNPSRDEEVRRLAVFWALVGMTALTLYFMASFFPNQDGAWHQTVVRDTALTPSHIPMFFFAFPLGITLSVGTYLYGRTRLPAVYGADKGFPWSHGLLISASVLEMVQVAFNEWGHSLWFVEELFAAPFHWPFVTYGWLAGGMFALWGETIMRLVKLDLDSDEEEAEPGAHEYSYAD